MRRQWILPVGILACLLAGVVAGLVAAHRHDEPASITVPVGRWGDRSTFLLVDNEPRNGTADDPGDWTFEGGWAFRHTSTCTTVPETVLDRASQPREAAALTCVHQQPAAEAGPRPGPSDPYRVDTYDLAQYVALDNAEYLAMRHPEPGPTSKMQIDYTPWVENGASWVVQGRTLRVGDEVLPPTQIPSYGWYWRVGDPQEEERRPGEVVVGAILHGARVVASGHVGDQRALAVDHVVRIFDPDMNETQRHVTRSWFADAAPYPLLQDRFAEYLDDAASSRFVARTILTSYEAGSSPIRWGGGDTAPPLLRRAPAHHQGLADGDEGALAFPLSLALDAASNESDALAAWNQEHPNAGLGGAILGADQNETTWSLLYVEPEGSALEIRVEALPDGTLRVEDGPERRVRLGWEPASGLVTLSSAIDAWRTLASEPYRSVEPNHVVWGGDWTIPIVPGMPTVTWLDPNHLDVGYLEPGPAPGTFRRDAVLRVNAEDATLHAYRERDRSNAEAYATWPPVPRIEDPGALLPAGFRFPEPSVTTWATSSLVVVFFAAYFAPLLKWTATKAFLGVSTYTRLAPNRLLDQPVREALVGAIRADPGLSAAELRRRIGVGWGTVVHHLNVLEKNGVVSSLVDGRDRRFFPVGALDWSRRPQVALLRHDRTRSLYEFIQAEPGIHQASLAHRAGLSRPAAIWHLDRLEEAGLIDRARRGRRVTYHPRLATTDAPPAMPRTDAA